MIGLPHLYVLPLGVPEPRRTCLVCQAQERLGVAIFVNPIEPALMARDPGVSVLMEALGRLRGELEPALTSVVAQHGASVVRDEEGEFRDIVPEPVAASMLTATERLDASVRRVALPGGVVPGSLPIAPDAPETVLLYRYRQIVDIQGAFTAPRLGVRGAVKAAEVAAGLHAFVAPWLDDARAGRGAA